MKKNNYKLLLIPLILIGCHRGPESPVDNNMTFSIIPNSKVDGSLYFPSRLPNETDLIDDKLDDFRNEWYSKHLASMNEPILFNKTGGNLQVFRNEWYSEHLANLNEPVLFNKSGGNLQVFRYTNLGTFSNPFCIRIELKNSNIIIHYKQTDGQGGYGAGKLIKDIQKQLKIEDWERLLSNVESTQFWDKSTYRIPSKNRIEELPLDGTEWVFEGLIGGRYHFMTRTNPELIDEKVFASLCNLMHEMSSVIDKKAARESDPH